MTEIEMYIETVKAVHNQNIEVINRLEDTLHDAYIDGLIPTYGNADVKDTLIIMHSIIDIVCKALKDTRDATIEKMESEM